MSGALDLTQRERRVMELLAQGLTTKQIAWRLRIAPATARRHIGSAAGRLGAIDRRSAVAAYRRTAVPGSRRISDRLAASAVVGEAKRDDAGRREKT